MKVIIENTIDEMSMTAAQHLLGYMYRHKRVNLSITGGTTPGRMYEMLVPMVKGKDCFSNVHYYNFDEIPYRAEDREGVTISGLRSAFFTPAVIAEDNIHVLDQHNYICQDDRIAADGGLDMILLGVGADGHYCGNLPGTTRFGDKTVKVACNDRIKSRLAGEFEGATEHIPDYYITMGPRSIMGAGSLVMIASGTKKAGIVKQLVEGIVDEAVPATLLTLHPSFTLIIDKDAASLL